MKSIITTISILLASHFSFAQNFYKSIDDYKAGKPIDSVKIANNSWRMVMGRETVELEKNNTKDRVKASDFPSELLTYGGRLVRVSDGHLYYVLVEGKYCYYVMKK